jgi:polyisoprenoid-binding protein YceI
VAFEVEHNTLQAFRARFTDYSAELHTEGDGIGIKGSVAVDSVQISLDKLREVVLGDEFLDGAKHPEITFESSDISLGDDGSLEVKGTLGIKGNSGEVTARGKLSGPVTDLHGSLRVSVQLEAVINRNEYGLEWHADLEGGEAVLGDDVKLIANLELAQG